MQILSRNHGFIEPIVAAFIISVALFGYMAVASHISRARRQANLSAESKVLLARQTEAVMNLAFTDPLLNIGQASMTQMAAANAREWQWLGPMVQPTAESPIPLLTWEVSLVGASIQAGMVPVVGMTEARVKRVVFSLTMVGVDGNEIVVPNFLTAYKYADF